MSEVYPYLPDPDGWPEVPWGLCAFVAARIVNERGGRMVGGVVATPFGAFSHWWAEVDGVAADPMVDAVGVEVEERREWKSAHAEGGLAMAQLNLVARRDDPARWDRRCRELTNILRGGVVPDCLVPTRREREMAS